ncbi:MAG: hypothetical protein ACR2PV_00215, partial [Gammaproteobacteria bacterium]
DSSSGVLSVDDSLVLSVVYAVTVRVQDADGRQAQAEANIEALAPLSLVLLPGIDGTLTVAARIVANIHTFRASQGSRGYTYSLNPAISGFSIGSSGVLRTDSNLNPGLYTVIVQVEDKKGATPAQTSITVEARGLEVLGFGTKIWGVGAAGNIHTFKSQYGAPPYTYDLRSFDAFLNVDGGVLSLDPIDTLGAGAHAVIVRVTDSRGVKALTTVTLDLRAVTLPGKTTEVGGEIRDVVVALVGGRPYGPIYGTVPLHTFQAKYGAPPYEYIVASPKLPGYSIGLHSGVVSADGGGEAGRHTLHIQVTDSKGGAAKGKLVVMVSGSTASSPPPFYHTSREFAMATSRPPTSAGGGLSFLIMTPPASSLWRPRTPPTSAGGENYLLSHPPL